MLAGVSAESLNLGVQTVGRDIQPFSHVSHRVTALGHLLDGFDFEFVGVAFALIQAPLFALVYLTARCLQNQGNSVQYNTSDFPFLTDVA